MTSPSNINAKGSIWHRWEPHIHTPGTVLNDQYTGTNPWEDFLSEIEKSAPVIKAIGITDYYSIESYKAVLLEQQKDRLPAIELIFPNIELRFAIGTARDSAINGHLLVSPDDPKHVEETERFLQKLEYSVGPERFRCQKSDLIKLGFFHDNSITDEKKALEAGTNQFKVTFKDLEQAFKDSAWARENILLAVSANTGDGTSGLSKDASFSSTRQYIERTANIIFAGSESQRNFWLGNGVVCLEELIEKYNGCKPCIHGSDAHSLEKVGKPDLDRYTWIKGDLIYETLRQICIEPSDRVFIGPAYPNNQISSNVIASVSISNAPWINNSKLDINSGLVAIIGSRGSGKTALADLIAVGGCAIRTQLSSSSFIQRAKEHLSDVFVTLDWQTGNSTSQSVNQIDYEDLWDVPRIQYLSQQFVDQLCSSEAMTDELMNEVERVIFISHPPEQRVGIVNFQDLLSQRASLPRQERVNQQEIIDSCALELTIERIKKNSLTHLRKKFTDKEALINTDKANREKLVVHGDNSKTEEFQKISAALDKVSVCLDGFTRKKQKLSELKLTVEKAKQTTFPGFTSKLRQEYTQADLSDEQWNQFEVKFIGDVDDILQSQIAATEKSIQTTTGEKVVQLENASLSLLPAGIDLENIGYELLNQELDRLKQLIGAANEKGKQYTRLSEKLVKEEAELDKFRKEIADAESADKRILEIMGRRKNAYQQVFDAIIEEERTLKELYLPLMRNLTSQDGSLGKLSFKVHRTADVQQWSSRGEELLDLRKNGSFKNKGTLLSIANCDLKYQWENGNAEANAETLAKFREEHHASILEHSLVERSDTQGYSNWLTNISNWLYSTDHISISYGLQYQGVDIKQLSPGTRGIVLLLLYLAIDQEDDRPLVIDQPEENLDPKSIFDELVPLFRSVKKRRQIIIVTHNANLVVNTDADQVIVASAGSHLPNHLPQITYHSGGLENPEIRKWVCGILEGGEKAFKERARRLRVVL